MLSSIWGSLSESEIVMMSLVSRFETGFYYFDYDTLGINPSNPAGLSVGWGQIPRISEERWLEQVCDLYCEQSDSQFKDELEPWMDEIQDQSSREAENSRELHNLLKEMASDPLWCRAQDSVMLKRLENVRQIASGSTFLPSRHSSESPAWLRKLGLHHRQQPWTTGLMKMNVFDSVLRNHFSEVMEALLDAMRPEAERQHQQYFQALFQHFQRHHNRSILRFPLNLQDEKTCCEAYSIVRKEYLENQRGFEHATLYRAETMLWLVEREQFDFSYGMNVRMAGSTLAVPRFGESSPLAFPPGRSFEDIAVAPFTVGQIVTIQAVETIIETGKYTLDSYWQLTVLGDRAGITFGKNQTTENGGGLRQMLNIYLGLPEARYAGDFLPYMSKLYDGKSSRKKFALTKNQRFKDLLVEAATEDPVFRLAERIHFARNYFEPMLPIAEQYHATLPLFLLVMYDMSIHSGHKRAIRQIHKFRKEWKVPEEFEPDADGNVDYDSFSSEERLAFEKALGREVIERRHHWLLNVNIRDPKHREVVRKSSYRTYSMLHQADLDNWELSLPLDFPLIFKYGRKRKRVAPHTLEKDLIRSIELG